MNAGVPRRVSFFSGIPLLFEFHLPASLFRAQLLAQYRDENGAKPCCLSATSLLVYLRPFHLLALLNQLIFRSLVPRDPDSLKL
jgi:hypothetical protein